MSGAFAAAALAASARRRPLRPPRRGRARASPDLLRRPLGLRANHLRRALGERRAAGRVRHPRFLSSRPRALRRADDDAAAAGDAQEPQVPAAARAVPKHPRAHPLSARLRAIAGGLRSAGRSSARLVVGTTLFAEHDVEVRVAAARRCISSQTWSDRSEGDARSSGRSCSAWVGIGALSGSAGLRTCAPSVWQSTSSRIDLTSITTGPTVRPARVSSARRRFRLPAAR